MQDKNKKICITSISLGKGGSDRVCAQLSILLSNLGYDVHIVILDDIVKFPYKGKLLNLGTLKTGSENILRRLLRLRHLRNYLKKEKIDIIIDHRAKTNFFKTWYYHNKIYQGFKTIYVVHSARLETYFGKENFNLQRFYAANDINVAVSDGIKQKIEKEVGLTNFETIYNPIFLEWEQLGNLEVELPPYKYILWYGRIDDEVKDLRFLIQSYSASELPQHKIKLLIMGDGKDLQKMKELASKESMQEFIKFTAFTSNPFPYVKNAMAVCLTSKWEGFPMVLIESLYLGTPVISLDMETGPNEIIQNLENGLLIKERKVSLFTQGLNTICLDNERRAIMNENAKISVRKFSSEMVSKSWDKIINR